MPTKTASALAPAAAANTSTAHAPLVIQIDPNDNVVVAIKALTPGTYNGVVVREDIPGGHKIARRDIKAGELVIKYGYPIGRASVDIPTGKHVHSQNVKSHLDGDLTGLRYAEVAKSQKFAVTKSSDTFLGFRRPDGRAAIRNEVWIINTVGCVNHTAERIARAAAAEHVTPGSGIDGINTFVHPLGCSQLGDDLIHTQKVLAGLVNHPNAAAVLILGLGCENNQMKDFLGFIGEQPAGRVKFFNAQEVSDETESGLVAVRELVAYAKKFKREAIPASELILGMKCGGSDGFSGITANPAVGRIADKLTGIGGTVILTEVPEMFGAERVLLERATSENAFNGLIKMVNDFRGYFRKYNEPIDENPSPGNKAGGITTLAEKSLGCVQKGGRAPVHQVLAYGARAHSGLGGLALLNAPGNDGVSGTAMTIAGAHMILFTTGRGNPMGFPIPTLKVATNSDLATRKPNWIDVNTGPLVEGVTTPEEMTATFWKLILDIASGRTLAKNEQHGYREIAIWKDGVTL